MMSFLSISLSGYLLFLLFSYAEYQSSIFDD